MELTNYVCYYEPGSTGFVKLILQEYTVCRDWQFTISQRVLLSMQYFLHCFDCQLSSKCLTSVNSSTSQYLLCLIFFLVLKYIHMWAPIHFRTPEFTWLKFLTHQVSELELQSKNCSEQPTNLHIKYATYCLHTWCFNTYKFFLLGTKSMPQYCIRERRKRSASQSFLFNTQMASLDVKQTWKLQVNISIYLGRYLLTISLTLVIWRHK